jgi:hypothetical protein
MMGWFSMPARALGSRVEIISSGEYRVVGVEDREETVEEAVSAAGNAEEMPPSEAVEKEDASESATASVVGTTGALGRAQGLYHEALDDDDEY